MVGSPCDYGRLQNPFRGQIWFCCLFLPRLGLKQLKAIAQSQEEWEADGLQGVLVPELCQRALGHRELNDSHSF